MSNKRGFRGCALAVLMLVALMFCVPALAAEGVTDVSTNQVSVENIRIVPDAMTESNDELFEAYVQRQFYPVGRMRTLMMSAADRLTSEERTLYEALVPYLKQIANGTRASTSIALGTNLSQILVNGVPTDFPVDTHMTLPSVFNKTTLGRLSAALLADYPYEMYWFDKVTGCQFQGISTVDGTLLHLTISFEVSDNYQGSGFHTVDIQKTGAAAKAVKKAWNIIKKHSSKSDYDKLVAYKNEICSLVSYDFEAAASGDLRKNNSTWQMINVFDGDPSTNVVCEGYSKAFQYLVDMSSFDTTITSRLVTGTMRGGTGEGAHMWNVVTMGDCKNYLVDVTNSDTGAVGADGCLFLKGAYGSVSLGYFCVTEKYDYIYFDYDKDLIWDKDELELAYFDYDPKTHTHACKGTPVFQWNEDGTCIVSFTCSGSDRTVKRLCKVTVTEAPAQCEKDGELVYRAYVTINRHEYSDTKAETTAKATGHIWKNNVCSVCGKNNAAALAKPVIKVENASTGVKVSWGKVTGAAGYEVYRSTNGSSWTKVKTTTDTSYTDTAVSKGKACYYMVKAYRTVNGKKEYSGDKSTKFMCLSQPVVKIENLSTGMKVSWGKVSGAAGYEVYRSINGSSWTKIKTTTGTSYTDTAVSKGKSYYYTVKAYATVSNKKVYSSCDKTLKVIRLSQPVIKLENPSGGVKISWGKVNGAAGYEVYRSTNGSSWTKIKTTTGTSYTDTTAAKGKMYYYTTKAYATVNGKRVYSSFDKTQKVILLAKPIIKLENASTGVKVSWGKVTGAAGYEVYRSTNGSSWTKIKTTTGTSYTDAAVSKGKTCYYTVKAYISANGVKAYSSCDKTQKIICLAQPAVKLENVSTGVKISWGKVSGVSGYEIYRSANGSSWTKIKTTTGASYTDTTASKGKTYYYTVKAYATVSSKKVYSSCDKTQKIIRLTVPSVKVSAITGGIKTSWGKVTGAAKYEVYRSADGKKWTKLKTVTGLNYTDKSVAKGKTYYYTVKAVKETQTSAFKASKAVKRIK